MECERLVKLVKSWYLQVKDEALAPARMVAFMEKHVAECPVCMVDDGVRQEVDRITRIVLPPSKLPKPKTSGEDDEDEVEEEKEESTDDDENEEESDDDNDDDEDDDSSDDTDDDEEGFGDDFDDDDNDDE